MTYEEFLPDPLLRSAVASYWKFALPHAESRELVAHTIPPDGTVSLCWLPPGRAVVVGPRVTALRVPVYPGMEYLGVRFLPGAAGPLLGFDLRSVRGQVLPVDRPDFAQVMRESGIAGLDSLFLRWVESAGWVGPDPIVAEVARRIIESDGAAPVSALLRGLPLSYRQLLRRFYKSAGLTPKEFSRLRRLRAACVAAVESQHPLWAGISADSGFADQSHLVREFQDIFGWPPSLVHEYLRRIEHRMSSG